VDYWKYFRNLGLRKAKHAPIASSSGETKQYVPTAPAFIAPACAPTKYWTIFKVENQIIQVQVGIIGYQATT